MSHVIVDWTESRTCPPFEDLEIRGGIQSDAATSQDGITFTPDEGYAITDGYVDPFMLKAEDGDWVLLLSTTPATQRLPQRIYIATSPDGVQWNIDDDPILFDEDRNYLDPAAVEISPGEWLVVISTLEKANALSGPYEHVGGAIRLR